MELFSKKEECCGCGACMNACPKGAICMENDEYGFSYPKIDDTLCVECGLCKKVCGYQNGKQNPKASLAYAAISKDFALVMNSASGGMFAHLAGEILSCGGVVYGCSMEYKDGELSPEHIRVNTAQDLIKLQGSKYVQSDMGFCFRAARDDLESGKKVLFSGTPCQIASLNAFLGKRYDNLITVDIICHGVPPSKQFRDYIKLLNTKNKKVVGFRFRDKSAGWGMRAAIDYANGKTVRMPAALSSYFKLFLDSVNYQHSCYSCRFACTERPADITVGDYWGIETVHPEALYRNGGVLDSRGGISCVLLNTEKGKEFFAQNTNALNLQVSTVWNVASGNDQLNHPSTKPKEREVVLELYRTGGWRAVDKWYNKRLGARKYKILLKEFIKKCLGRA